MFAAAQAAAAVARIRSSRPARFAGVRTGTALLSGGLFGAAGAVILLLFWVSTCTNGAF